MANMRFFSAALVYVTIATVAYASVVVRPKPTSQPPFTADNSTSLQNKTVDYRALTDSLTVNHARCSDEHLADISLSINEYVLQLEKLRKRVQQKAAEYGKRRRNKRDIGEDLRCEFAKFGRLLLVKMGDASKELAKSLIQVLIVNQSPEWLANIITTVAYQAIDFSYNPEALVRFPLVPACATELPPYTGPQMQDLFGFGKK